MKVFLSDPSLLPTSIKNTPPNKIGITAANKIRLTYSSTNPSKPYWLEIGFHRTIRVPDVVSTGTDIEASFLPPDLGQFPLYQTSKFQNLPVKLQERGGIFIGMYQREALWVSFKSYGDFAIKAYAGDVNVVSGRIHREGAQNENPGVGRLGRKTRSMTLAATQDYLVVPKQRWIDGFAVKKGLVRQFVAMRLGDGFTVEGQKIGSETAGGLRFEITPRVPHFHPKDPTTPSFTINIKTLSGKTITFNDAWKDMTVVSVKEYIEAFDGYPVGIQKLIFEGRQLEDDRLLSDYGIEEGTTLYLVLRLCGGGGRMQPDREMGLAAGGLIHQTIHADTIYDYQRGWDKTPGSTVSFNVSMLTIPQFQTVTGLPPPSTPVSAASYKKAGLPFYKLSDEEEHYEASFIGGCDVEGDFQDVKSVAELLGEDEKMLHMDVKEIAARRIKSQKTQTKEVFGAWMGNIDILDPNGPKSPFKDVGDLQRENAGS